MQRYGAAVSLADLLGVFLMGALWAPAALAQAAPSQLERGNGPEPSTLDAHRCQEVACGNVLRDLYEGLVTEDARGRLVPGMAERWSVSADGRSWTFVLRGNLRWSNGEPIDAGQVVASFRRAFAPATAAPFGELFDALDNAQAVQAGKLPPERLGVSAPDPRSVRFRLNRSASLPALLTLPIAFPVYLPAVETHGAQHTRPGQLVSNGAYRLAAWTPQANLLLEKNPRFHDAAAVAIERVRFQVTEDAAAELQRFAAGDLHITEVVPPQPLASLRARFGSQLRLSPYLGAFWLGLNVTRPPFRSDACATQDCDERALALRRALSMAIDRDKLTRYVTGLGETPAYGIVPPGIAGYVPATTTWATRPQAQREAHARALYRHAGYSSDNPLVIELRYNTSTPHRRLALAVAAMWRQTLGVQVRLRNEEWKVFVQNRKQRTITQVFRGGWIGDLADARNFLAAFGSDGPLNWMGYDDAAYRERLAKADAAKSESARNAWLRAAEQRLLNDDAAIPLYFYSSKHLVSRRVRGFESNALDRHASRWLSLTP
ncbi:bacterial extracellular solute-binding s, 5 Middle family protein [Lysobacter antibioticus]|uniref:peptide ABC transporter substrate-binding protein n=1 Tax=Lysobacter antibioticus TaxID=84531 RepID=UPI00071F589D|nr:peptide ABC transporter substrate-binding protein [Lysobacter antibioticus]ALN65847.1 bacterial extracellular solute-binding s, 5 Middle family protein [Lysobacter antibioticus]